MSTPIYFDLDGSHCTQERAVALLQDVAARTLAETPMGIAGHDVLVSTVFAIVDQANLIYNVNLDRPLLWVTEVFGGPPDIDGTFGLSETRDEALEHHALMVERMIASGCYVL